MTGEEITELWQRLGHSGDVSRYLTTTMTPPARRMSLAAIRKASGLTQIELAERLGSNQGNVARTERGGDMMLSTLLAYLEAVGAHNAVLVATVAGERIEVAVDAG